MESRRHHYIPEFYIKGFTNDDGKLWIYDKLNNRIFPTSKSPKSIFFTHNLNTLTIEDFTSDFIEKYFSKIESNISRRISLLSDTTKIESPKELYELSTYVIQLISLIFWRSPFNYDDKKQFLKQLESLNPEVNKLKNKENWNTIDITNQDKIIMSYFSSFALTNIKDVMLNFRMFKGFNFLVTDNPVIYKNKPRFQVDLVEPLLFPLGKDRLFISSGKDNWKFDLDDYCRLSFYQINQAYQYVGSNDKEHLNNLVELYNVAKLNLDQQYIEEHIQLFENMER